MRLIPLIALLGGCLPAVNLNVLQPAAVTLPDDVKVVAVVDRSRPNSTGQGVLGTLEGAITGEDIMADRDGAREAVRSISLLLSESPRFDVVVPSFDRKKQESDLFAETLSWDAAQGICKRSGCDAIVSLEAFDSDNWTYTDSYVDSYTDVNGRLVSSTLFTAQRDTEIVSAWRVYWPAKQQILDDLRDYSSASTWEGEGLTKAAAIAALPDSYDAVVNVGHLSGRAYGQRIAPTWIAVSRSYYGGGHEQLKKAKRNVKAGDWEGAARIWETLLEHEDDKVRGKALFNYALWLEREGYLRKARTRAKEAAVALNKRRARTYNEVLHQRVQDRKIVRGQMEPAGGVPGDPGTSEEKAPEP